MNGMFHGMFVFISPLPVRDARFDQFLNVRYLKGWSNLYTPPQTVLGTEENFSRRVWEHARIAR